jgi:nitrite reductase (NO-forming)
VDHSIFRAFNKGALAMINVDGPENTVVYSGRQADEVYLPEGGAIQTLTADAAAAAPPATTRAERMTRGDQVYTSVCAACHQPGGRGIPAAFPPLANSDYLNADRNRAISVVLFGLTGTITVNGASFNSVMPALGMSDADVASVLTYVYGNWGNAGFDITPEEVAAVRAAGPPATAAVTEH